MGRPGAFAGFLDWLRELSAVRERHIHAVGSTMVAVEATALVLLMPASTSAAGLALAAGTVACFAASIAWLSRRGVTAACRCFGTSDRPMGPAEVVRNAVLSLVAATAAIAASAAPRPDPRTAQVLLAAIFGGALAMVVVRADEIYRLLAPRHGRV